MSRLVVSIFAVSFLFLSSASALIRVSPGWINFGYVDVNDFGVSQNLIVTSYNPGPASIRVSHLGCTGYSIWPRGCGQLMPSQSCAVTVRFRPVMPGYYSCSLLISDGYNDHISVSISGQGVRR